MKEKDLYDITEVCEMLSTTSRTLRFYEEKGLIQSTPGASRRRYTKEQIANIRNILVLRALGVSIKNISELLNENAELKETLLLKRAQIEALIETKQKELIWLNKALLALAKDKSIFDSDLAPIPAFANPRIDAIVKECNESVIGGNCEALYNHFGDTMKRYLPKSVLESTRIDTLAPLGDFVSYDRLEYDQKYPHIVYQYVKYEKLGLKIKYVFYGEKIEGFWIGYYEI